MAALSNLGDVSTAMLTKLKESGLDEADVKKLRFKPFINGEAKAIGVSAPGFQIPYFDFKGKPTQFWRYRLLSPQKQKYFQPPDSGVHPYLPPYISWDTLRQDASIPIIITEGELKAACACKLGRPTIGLGGVWCFKSKKERTDFLPIFKEFNWVGRKVFICFDSDAATNHLVVMAENALASELFSEKAKPCIVRLPSMNADASKKTGLDDFLMHKKGGLKRFDELLHSAESWDRASALFEMNEEVIYVKDPSMIIRRDTQQRMQLGTFVHEVYADRFFNLPTPTEDDPFKTKRVSTPAEWIKWKGRSTAERLTYAPGQPEITSKGEYNTWKKWGVEPKRGSIAPWKELLDFLFKNSPASDRTYFEQWLAYPLQHPGTKLLTAVVLWSLTHGIGKSLIGYTMARIYGSNFAEIGDNEIEGSFNGWAENKQFVMGDEISGGDKRHLSSKVKSLITQQKIRINAKYVPTYDVPDCINYLWTSQHCDAFYIEDKDRRFFVHEIKGAAKDPRWYHLVYDPWYKSEEGAAALFYHLLHLDLSGFDPRNPAPMTDAKAEMISDGKGDLALWVSNLPEYSWTLPLMTSGELLLKYDPMGQGKVSVNGISRAMKAAGYDMPLGRTPLVLDDGRQVRPWLIDKNLIQNTRQINQKFLKKSWVDCHKSPEIKDKKFTQKKK